MMKRFFSYYKPYKTLFIVDFFSAILVAIIELFFPLIVRKVTDDLLPTGDWRLIIVVSFGLFALYLLNSILQYIVTYYGHVLGVNIETDMRAELFEHIQKQSFSYFDERETGELMSRLTSDLFEISELAHHGPEDVFITLFTLGGAFALMLSIHVKLALATFVLIPMIAFALAFFNKKMLHVNTHIFKQLGQFSAGIEASVGGIREVQANANEEHEQAQFQVLNNKYRTAKKKFYQMMGLSSAYNYFFMRLISLFTLFFGAYFSLRGEISYGNFIAFILFSNIFVRPIEKVNNMIESYPKGIAGFKRLVEELDHVPAIQDEEGAIEAPLLKGDIEFTDVSFGYDAHASVLKDLSFSIRAGETIAFVGPSGAGKTTICSLIPRFYDATSGVITIDGIPLKNITLKSLRNQIGVVQQDVFLFPGTIKENVLYGRLDATDEEVHEAIRLANLEDVIAEMPNGIETVVGERGVRLSGGQKQRLSIARMFLKNPSILILDEATSALDTQTERAIQQALDSLSAGRTTLVIAHRLATITHADRIMVVTEEGLVEQGAHEELLDQKGAYHDLYEAQFGLPEGA